MNPPKSVQGRPPGESGPRSSGTKPDGYGEMRDSGQGDVIDRTDYTYHLTHTSEGWRINSETFTFEPGYGP